MILDPSVVREDAARALREDRATEDLSAALVPDQTARARILCRQRAVLCGIPWVEEVFHQLETSITLDWQAKDGDRIQADATVCELRGPARPLLQGERSALNFLQLLSATASRARAFARALDDANADANASCVLLDTRKTIPGLRHAQKYAVERGGCVPHRSNLAEAVLIKENHWALIPDIRAAIREARARHPDVPVIVEVESMVQLGRAHSASPDIILLDNFSDGEACAAAAAFPGIPLEISGGITKRNLADYVGGGAARVSVGTLTKDVKAVDFSMRMERA